jgi:hypothetical protein
VRELHRKKKKKTKGNTIVGLIMTEKIHTRAWTGALNVFVRSYTYIHAYGKWSKIIDSITSTIAMDVRCSLYKCTARKRVVTLRNCNAVTGDNFARRCPDARTGADTRCAAVIARQIDCERAGFFAAARTSIPFKDGSILYSSTRAQKHAYTRTRTAMKILPTLTIHV